MESSKLITREDCEQILKDVINSENIMLSNFSLQSVQDDYNLKIFFYQDSKLDSLQFFVRASSEAPVMSTILNDFKQNIPGFNVKIAPKLYCTKKKFQVFEYLPTSGFQTVQGVNKLNLHHLYCVLETLAEMHAASFAFENITSQKLDAEYGLSQCNKIMQQLVVAKADKLGGMVNELKEKQVTQKFRRAFCHGRLLQKNIFFKYENKVPIECRIVGYTSVYYGVPITDVLQAIFFNTNEEFRQHHFHSLLEYYYTYLGEELKKFNLDCGDIFPHKQLLAAVDHFLPSIKLQKSYLEHKNLSQLVNDIIHGSKLLSREDCYLIVENKLKSADYKFHAYDVIPLNNISGFLGEYHKLEIEITHQNEDKIVNGFIKCSPTSGIPYEMACQIQSFDREIFMYGTIVPQMQNNNIDIINECLPQCYLQRYDDLVVFEDMSLLNYKNLDALVPLNFELLSLTVKKLARFHACSIILEEKLSYRLIDKYENYFTEQHFFIDENHLGSKMYITGLKSIPAAIELFPDIKTELNRKNFEKFWPKLQELFYTVSKTSDRYKNVLAHGDLWTSNLLVKFDDEKPIDCVFIDYQMIRYCPPAYDLLAVFYLTTERSTRKAFEEKLTKMYYDELDLILKDDGYSIEEIYPYEDLIDSINYMRPQMLVFAAIECIMTMCTPEEISSLLTNEEECRRLYFEDRRDFMKKMCQKSQLYKHRLKDCILDIFEYCNTMTQE